MKIIYLLKAHIILLIISLLMQMFAIFIKNKQKLIGYIGTIFLFLASILFIKFKGLNFLNSNLLLSSFSNIFYIAASNLYKKYFKIEFITITNFASLGLMLSLFASNFLQFALSIELFTICSYIITGFDSRQNYKSAETGVKYFQHSYERYNVFCYLINICKNR